MSIGFALTLAITVTGTSPVAAHDILKPEPRGALLEEIKERLENHPTLVSPEVAAAIDLDLVAKANGWELDVAEAHIKTQEIVTRTAQEIAKKFPKIYAGAQVGAPDEPSIIWVKGKPPQRLYQIIEAAEAKIEVAGGQRYSFEQQKERMQKIMRILTEQRVESASAELLPGGLIEIVIGTQEKAAEIDLPKDLMEAVRIEYRDGPAVILDHGRGGARVRTGSCQSQNAGGGCPAGFNLVDSICQNLGTGICTSGFAVEDGNGARGITIAAHCNGFTNFLDSTLHDICMTHQQQHIGSWGDIEWKTTTHIEPNQFFATATQVRSVTSISFSPLPGTSTCLYGRTSNNRTCETVRSSWASFTISGTAASGFVTTNGSVSQGGDSGGPWSLNNRADGSNTGRFFTNGITRGIMSAAYLFPAALGVSVRTSP